MSEMAEEEFPAGGQVAPRHGAKWLKLIITIVVVVVVVVACFYAINRLGAVSNLSGDAIAQVSNDWQAIFLANGQVYFGKVKSASDKTVVLTDIYYLQVVTKPLQQTQTGQTAAANQQQTQELTLIKLGNEIHGPADKMIINRDQVLLTEKLKNDSRVVQAINNYLQSQKTAAPAAPQK